MRRAVDCAYHPVVAFIVAARCSVAPSENVFGNKSTTSDRNVLTGVGGIRRAEVTDI